MGRAAGLGQTAQAKGVMGDKVRKVEDALLSPAVVDLEEQVESSRLEGWQAAGF